MVETILTFCAKRLEGELPVARLSVRRAEGLDVSAFATTGPCAARVCGY